MKNNVTELVFILDRSGSMHGMERDTVGGFNSMIANQKKLQGKAYVSTLLFDGECKVLHDRMDLQKIAPMKLSDFTPRGCTALMDALGGAIHHMGNVHKYARKEDVPERTMFVVITDGMENASQRYSADKVRQMIRRQKEKYGWEFLFLGANIDAVETARRYGIEEDRAVTYKADPAGTRLNYEVLDEAVGSIRKGNISKNWKHRIEEDMNGRK